MNKIEIDTEKKVFLLNGQPMHGVTKITINIEAMKIPEVMLTVMSELDIKLDDFDLKGFEKRLN